MFGLDLCSFHIVPENSNAFAFSCAGHSERIRNAAIDTSVIRLYHIDMEGEISVIIDSRVHHNNSAP